MISHKISGYLKLKIFFPDQAPSDFLNEFKEKPGKRENQFLPCK